MSEIMNLSFLKSDGHTVALEPFWSQVFQDPSNVKYLLSTCVERIRVPYFQCSNSFLWSFKSDDPIHPVA